MKKTEREKGRLIIQERGLVSYMNDTKWKELQRAVEEEMPFPPPLIIKLLSETLPQIEDFPPNTYYHGDWSDESFAWGDFFCIEWVKVQPFYYEYVGRLVPSRKIEDGGAFGRILGKYHIPYEKQGEIFIIYGYKKAPTPPKK